jgi:hypothetical protein
MVSIICAATKFFFAAAPDAAAPSPVTRQFCDGKSWKVFHSTRGARNEISSREFLF